MPDLVQQKILKILEDSLTDLAAKNSSAALRKAGDLRDLVLLTQDADEVLWLLWATVFHAYFSIDAALSEYTIPPEYYERVLKNISTKIGDLKRAVAEHRSEVAYVTLRDLALSATDFAYEAGYNAWDKPKRKDDE